MSDSSTRRGVLPQVAARSLWRAAAWTGAGSALVCAVLSIVAVAICWLPASGGSGGAGSSVRAGVLTFLAALHGGITVDGLSSAFVPLGMTALVGAVAWRAGSGLADTADDLGERGTRELVRAGALQAVVFATVCGVAAHLATLGTSEVSTVAAWLAGFLVFAIFGGTAFVRASPLAADLREVLPAWLGPALRAAGAGVAVYLAAGALLVAGSLVLHHGRVETLSHQVGGGWSGVPILLLGVLAAPNAVIAGAAYLAGPGFALGSGVTLGSTAHGTLPAFPLLGAVPSGPAPWPVWLLAAATPLVAGGCAARVVRGADGWRERLRGTAAAAGLAALAGAVLAWQGGGAIGSGRLATVGASPWQLGFAVGAGLALATVLALGVRAGLDRWRARDTDQPNVLRATLAAVGSAVTRDRDDADAITQKLDEAG